MDLKKLAGHLIPPFLRRTKLAALIIVLLIPFIRLYNLFTEYRIRISDRLDMSGRVQYLEKILNDAFSLDSGIFISDIPRTTIYLYHGNEMQNSVFLYKESSLPLSKLYLRQEGEGSYSGDFIVNVPSSIYTEENLRTIRYLLDYYKPAGRSYRINRYDNGQIIDE